MNMTDDQSECGSPQSTFEVRDEGSANWLVRRVLEARAYAAKVEIWAAAEILRAQREEERLLGRFGQGLETWVQAALASRRHKGRSLTLPAGRVGFRLKPATVSITDEQSLLNWCRQNLYSAVQATVGARGEQAVRLTAIAEQAGFDVDETVTMSEVKRYVTASGELPSGVEVHGRHDAFYIV